MLVRLKIELKSVTPLKVSFIFASPHDPETLSKDPIQCWGGHAEKCPSTVVRCKFTRVNVISTMVEPHYLHTNVWTGDGARESQELMDQLADDMDELMRLMQEGTGVNPCEGVIQINGYWLHQCPDLKTMVPSNPWPKDRKFLVFLSVHIADRNFFFSFKPFFWLSGIPCRHVYNRHQPANIPGKRNINSLNDGVKLGQGRKMKIWTKLMMWKR